MPALSSTTCPIILVFFCKICRQPSHTVSDEIELLCARRFSYLCIDTTACSGTYRMSQICTSVQNVDIDITASAIVKYELARSWSGGLTLRRRHLRQVSHLIDKVLTPVIHPVKIIRFCPTQIIVHQSSQGIVARNVAWDRVVFCTGFPALQPHGSHLICTC